MALKCKYCKEEKPEDTMFLVQYKHISTEKLICDPCIVSDNFWYEPEDEDEE